MSDTWPLSDAPAPLPPGSDPVPGDRSWDVPPSMPWELPSDPPRPLDIRRAVVLALALAAGVVPAARAADDPRPIPGANDTRLRQVAYSDRMLIRLTSTDLTPITITYGEGEKPTLIAGLKVVSITPAEGTTDPKAVEALVHSCADWCADRHGNELTLQPLKEDAGSMLMVTTEKVVDGGMVYHHYPYELRTRPGASIERKLANGAVVKDDPDAYFSVRYTYAAEDAARRAAAWRQAHAGEIAAAREAARQRQVSDRLAVASYLVPRNYKWELNQSKACAVLGPDRVSDDGRKTVMHFRMNAPVSVPNIVDDDENESIASFSTDKAPDSGTIVTINSVPGRMDPDKPAMVLRRDKLVCGLYNKGYNPNATAPNTGTASPDVVRETRR